MHGCVGGLMDGSGGVGGWVAGWACPLDMSRPHLCTSERKYTVSMLLFKKSRRREKQDAYTKRIAGPLPPKANAFYLTCCRAAIPNPLLCFTYLLCKFDRSTR